MPLFRLYSPVAGFWSHSDGTPIEHDEIDARGILKGLQLLWPDERWELWPLV